MPNSSTNRRATAPAATLAAVSRALERSRIGRISSNPYLVTPARSACPGRGRVSGCISCSGGETLITSFQFSQSRFQINKVIGLPIVSPWRTPDRISALSCSILIRGLRPYPAWRLLRSRAIYSSSKDKSAGTPSMITISPLPWDSPAVRKRNRVIICSSNP